MCPNNIENHWEIASAIEGNLSVSKSPNCRETLKSDTWISVYTQFCRDTGIFLALMIKTNTHCYFSLWQCQSWLPNDFLSCDSCRSSKEAQTLRSWSMCSMAWCKYIYLHLPTTPFKTWSSCLKCNVSGKYSINGTLGISGSSLWERFCPPPLLSQTFWEKNTVARTSNKHQELLKGKTRWETRIIT